MDTLISKVMKTKISKIAAFIALAMVVTNTACTQKNNVEPTPESDELKGRLTEDLRLKSGKTYRLTGSLQVVAPATLTIEPGVTIEAADNGEINYILIEQGAKIDAQGTKDAPIVMTSQLKETGAWGGLHICGKAHSNKSSKGGSLVSEIGNAPYGGDVENDNSGILRYLRLEYTGYKLDAEHEANGLSLYGVGNGTTISYVQCYKGSDDGIEFFGGSVNVDHCIVVDCTDDSFDWTEGWNGRGEYLVAYQSDPTCDCLMECDNNGDDFNAEPVAHPTLKYVTLVGNNSSENKRGIRLRAGTQVTLENALITGKPAGISAETTQTLNALKNGTSVLKNIYLSTVFSEKVEEGSESIYSSLDFLSDGTNKEGVTITLQDRFVGMMDGNGAISSSDDWSKGWTR